jgi:hypothetical protein
MVALGFSTAAVAVDVQFIQRSFPPAIIPLTSTMVSTGSVVSTLLAPVQSGSHRFTYWTINGYAYTDVFGRGINPVTFVITEPVDAIANYTLDSADDDADGIPDWFEYHLYASLTNSPASDTDADGLTLLDEYNRDTHPNLADATSDGGLSQRASPLLLLIQATNIVRFQTQSIPPGIVATNLAVPIGSIQLLPDLVSPQFGYYFAQWLVNGVRATDALGRSVGNLAITVVSNTLATAQFIAGGADTDADGIPDWFEYHYFGDTNYNATADTDADGVSLLDEFNRDTHPNLKDTISDGGISRRPSALVSYMNFAYASCHLISSPLGFIDTISVVPTNSAFTLPDLYTTVPTAGYRFVQWNLGDVRLADPLGRGNGYLTITITTNTTVTALYIPATADTNTNNIPDWFEYHYLGGLTNSTADTDADGYDLLTEYNRDTHPNLKDTISDGGISQRPSTLTFLDLRQYSFYKISSSPTGFVNQTGYVPNDTVITTPTAALITNGYAFGHWEIGGIRQQDTNGVAVNPVTFIPITNTTVTAIYYLQTADTDGDGIADWWEDRWFGGTTNAVASADPDGDALSNLEEYQGGSNPFVPDRTILSAEWLGGTSFWTNASKWSGGIVPNDTLPTNFVVYIDNGRVGSSIVTQNIAVTLERLKIDAGERLYLLPGISLTLHRRPTGGSITNSGTIALNGADSGLSELRIANGTGILAGGGTLTLSDHTNNVIRATETGTWLNNVNNTIRGSGHIGADNLGLFNSGTILANQSTPLILDPSDTLGFTNTGTVQINTNSTLIIQGPGFIQTAGTMRVNGTLIASNGLNITGGLLTGSGTNFANISNNGTLSPGIGLGSFTVIGDLTQRSNATLFVQIGGYDAGSNLDFIAVSGAATFAGTLRVALTNNFAQTVTNGASFIVLTAGSISGAFTNVANGGTLTTTDGAFQFTAQYSGADLVLNNLQILDTDADQLPNWWELLYFANPTNANPAADTDSDGLTNLEEFQGRSNPTVADRVVRSVDWLGGAGNWSGAAKWSPAIVPNDTLPTNFVVFVDHGNGVSSIVTQDISATIERLILDAGDTLRLLPGVSLTFYKRPTSGAVTNAGLIALNGSELRFANGAGTFTGGGVIELSDSTNNLIRADSTNLWLFNLDNTIRGSGNIGSNSLGIVNSGTIIANQTTPLVLDPADVLGFTNTGTIQINTGSTLILQGTGFVQTAGAFLVNGTLIASNGLDIAGGLLTGSGTNLANISNNGTLAPGSSTGIFTVIGDLTQRSNATLSVEIGSYSDYDFISVSSTVTFAGQLRVSLTNDFVQTITNGATFTVLTAGAISGAFTNVASGGTLVSTDGTTWFSVQYGGSNLVLSVLMTDADLDGMPSWWEDFYGFDRNNPADAPLDADGDGMSNLQEYLAGTHPHNPLSRLAITNFRRVTGDWEITFSAVSGKVYRVEYTSNLKTTNAWPILLDNITATSAVIQVVDPSATGVTNRFYRVRLKP